MDVKSNSNIDKAFLSFECGNYVEAINCFTQVINQKNSPDKTLSYIKAITDCNKALETCKTNEKIYLIKGKAQWCMGKKDLAKKTWTQGLEVKSDLLIYSELLKCISGESHQQMTTQLTAIVTKTEDSERPVTQNQTSTPSKNVNTNVNSVNNVNNSNNNKASCNNNNNNNNNNISQKSTKNNQASPTTSTTTTSSTSTPNKNASNSNITLAAKEKPSAASKDKSFDILEAFSNPQFDSLAQTAISQLKHGSGKAQIDKYIALGYYNVNSGRLEEGIKVFDQLLLEHPKIVAAFLGRGTAFALMGKYLDAIKDFSNALNIDPNCTDALKRRGQTQGACGLNDEALADFTKAISIEPDFEAYQQRGMIYYRKKNYKRALEDFTAASKLDHQDPVTWNHMGLCYNSTGDCMTSVDCHKKAIAINPKLKDAYANLGQTYKDWGKYDEAMEAFQQAIDVEPTSSFAYHLRGLTYFGAGEHVKAIADLKKSLSLKPNTYDCLIIAAVASHAIGQFKEAMKMYQECLAVIDLNPDLKNSCWYQKEIMLWWTQRLDVPTDTFNIDKALDPEFKEFYCKRQNPQSLKKYKPQPPLGKQVEDIKYNTKPTEKVAKILNFCVPIGKLLHQQHPGYHSNRRQQQMAGIAALEIAQRLRDFWFKNIKEESGSHSSSTNKNHTFGWRDVYDIVIKWRQVSEPNDPVWWVDLLTKEQFTEGFGSHTPMITGQCNVVRYSPMVARSFPIMKEEIIKQKTLSPSMKERVIAAKDISELYQVMKKDFWVVTPCHSTRSGTIIEGTRLTLQKTEPEGFEFSIRTPGTPPRWIDYDNEMTFLFDLLTQAVQTEPFDLEKVSNLILTISFYWYNFMPLSRGTAACGYVGILGMFLAVGYKINTRVPALVSTDWEAILRPTPKEFIAQISPWMYPARTKINVEEFDKLPRVNKTIHTIRKMIEALNCEINV